MICASISCPVRLRTCRSLPGVYGRGLMGFSSVELVRCAATFLALPSPCDTAVELDAVWCDADPCGW